MLRAFCGALVVLAVGLVQVGTQVLAGRHGGGRGEDRGRAAPSSRQGQSSADRLAASVPSAAVAARNVSN